MLKDDFNNIIQKKFGHTDINRIIEPKLVTCLITAINGSARARSFFCHQKYTNFLRGTKKTKRELCDILVIVKHRSCFRYSFIQNKRVKNSCYSGLDTFTINCGQHYLLVSKPEIIINGTCTTILKNSLYDTITTYSVFYNDNFGKIDFDLSSACSVVCNGKNKFSCCLNTSSTAQHCHNILNYNNKNCEIDFDSHVNLNEIERNNQFGEVIYPSKGISDLATILSSFNIPEIEYNGFFGEKQEDVDSVIQEKNHAIPYNVIVPRLLLIDMTDIEG